MFLHTQKVGLLVLVVCLVNLCHSLFAADKEGDGKASREVEAIVQSNNQFAFDLYTKLRSSESGNLFFSPTSISTALAMTYAGAEGKAEIEMAAVLRFKQPEAQVHAAFASLTATLNAPNKDAYELRMANRLWGQTGYGFRPEYLATTRTQYGAELAQVDFIQETEKARQQINVWVEKQTKNKIQDLLPEEAIDDMTRLVLTNAIYFKGKWVHPFDKKATQEGPFTVSADTKVTVPLMLQSKNFKYGETDLLQLLEMPYIGNDLSMLILLPKKADGLSALEKSLSAENLKKWSSSMKTQEIQIHIPRFKMTEQLQLNSLLAELGMPSAFDPDTANFSGMNGKDRDLYISAAIHKAFVDVNEEGTEAAAATGVVVGLVSARIPKAFRADHPFVFLIQDQRTGSILFLGRVTNPKGSLADK